MIALAQMGSVEVHLVDCLTDYYKVSLKEARLRNIKLNYPFVKIHKADITDKSLVDELFKNNSYDCVINLAAQPGVTYAQVNPASYISANVTGFFNIVDAAARNNCKHILYASTSSVYGDNKHMPWTEDLVCNTPLSIYSATKLADEHLAHAYATNYDMVCVGLRFFNVYGPWGRPDAVYYKWADAISNKKPIELRGGGLMKRDMTYIDDAVRSLLLLMSYFYTLKRKHGLSEIVNIGNSSPVSVKDVLVEMKRMSEGTVKVNKKPKQPSEALATYADTAKLKKLIGYTPNTDYKEGIRRFIQWYNLYEHGEGI